MTSPYNIAKTITTHLPKITTRLYGAAWGCETDNLLNSRRVRIVDEAGEPRTEWMSATDAALWFDGFMTAASEMFA